MRPFDFHLRLILTAVALLAMTSLAALAAVPETTSFQGVLTDAQGQPLDDGQHALHVRLYDDPTGGTMLWDEQHQVTTTQGRFHVILGSVTPLTLPFDQPYWLSTEVDGDGEMTPRIALTGSPYALNARSVDDGAAVRSLNGLSDEVTLTGNGGISVSEVGSTIVIDGAGGTGGDSDWFIDGQDMYAIPEGSVGIGTDTPSGKFHVHGESFGTGVFVSDTTPDVAFHDAYIQLETPFGDSRLEFFSAGSPVQSTLNISGGTGDDEAHVRVSGRSLLLDTDEELSFEFGGTERARFNSSGQLVLQRSDESTTTVLLSGEPEGRIILDQSGGNEGLDLASDSNLGAFVQGHAQDGGTNFLLRAERGGGNDGGYLALWDGTGSVSATLGAMHDGSQGTAGGELELFPNGSSDHTIQIVAQESGSASQGGQISIHNDSGLATIILDGDHGSSDAANVELRDAAGNVTVRLDSDDGGQGRITTDVLEITAGADLSERFEVRAAQYADEPRPGMVVSIDTERPGELALSTEPYDTRVAGVISGAGGVQPGMLMGQRGSVADGEHPVALTGRVYVRADASERPIRPGDLLTTSSEPGHAMAVGEHDRAAGAILGKAMTGLDEGRGLVLVLVSLQ